MEEMIDLLTNNLKGYDREIGRYRIEFINDKLVLIVYIGSPFSGYLNIENRIEATRTMISKHINRELKFLNSKYTNRTNEVKFEILLNYPVVSGLKTLNYKVLCNSKLEKKNYYEKDHIIIDIINNLKDNMEVNLFNLKENTLYFENKPVIIINYLKDSTYMCNRGGSYREYDCWDYHFYEIESIYDINFWFNELSIVQKSFNSSNPGFMLKYGAVGRENMNWVVKDVSTGNKFHYKTWYI